MAARLWAGGVAEVSEWWPGNKGRGHAAESITMNVRTYQGERLLETSGGPSNSGSATASKKPTVAPIRASTKPTHGRGGARRLSKPPGQSFGKGGRGVLS